MSAVGILLKLIKSPLFPRAQKHNKCINWTPFPSLVFCARIAQKANQLQFASYTGVQAVEKWLQRALYQGFYSKITHLPVYWCE